MIEIFPLKRTSFIPSHKFNLLVVLFFSIPCVFCNFREKVIVKILIFFQVSSVYVLPVAAGMRYQCNVAKVTFKVFCVKTRIVFCSRHRQSFGIQSSLILLEISMLQVEMSDDD